MDDTNLTEETTDKEETVAEEIAAEEEIVAEEETVVEEIAAEEETVAKEETVVKEETASTKANSGEKTKEESEFLEGLKESLKKNIHTWTIILVILAVVGLPLCLIIYGIAMEVMAVINFLALKKTKEFLERLENGEVSVKEAYEFLETLQRRGRKMFVLNFFFGLVFPLVGNVNDVKISEAAMKEGLDILGDDYKNERMANDPNAKWKYCVYCKKNNLEVASLYKMKDGVICCNCVSPYTSMMPIRIEDPATPSIKTANTMNFLTAIANMTSKDLEERLEYLKKNQEEYSYFTPTRVICDGCLELDETNFLFRIVRASGYDSERDGKVSGLVHPYNAIKGIAYEMVYEYETGDENTRGGWKYRNNTIVFALNDNPYLNAEAFSLKSVPTKLFGSSKKPQNEYAEQMVKELEAIFKAPVLESRKLHRN